MGCMAITECQLCVGAAGGSGSLLSSSLASCRERRWGLGASGSFCRRVGEGTDTEQVNLTLTGPQRASMGGGLGGRLEAY